MRGQRIDFLDGEIFGLHQAHGFQHDEHADPVGDEVRRIAREHNLFAHALIGEMSDGFDGGGVRVGSRNDLHQAHVAPPIQ